MKKPKLKIVVTKSSKTMKARIRKAIAAKLDLNNPKQLQQHERLLQQIVDSPVD